MTESFQQAKAKTPVKTEVKGRDFAEPVIRYFTTAHSRNNGDISKNVRAETLFDSLGDTLEEVASLAGIVKGASRISALRTYAKVIDKLLLHCSEITRCRT